MSRRQKAVWLAAFIVLQLLPFAHRASLIGGDEPHYALMAYSIGVDGDLDVRDDYDAVEAGSQRAGRKHASQSLARHVRDVEGREVFIHPVGQPLLAAPVVAVLHAFSPSAAPDLALIALTLAVTSWAVIAAWKLLIPIVGSTRDAAVVILFTYFGSPLWFYSRTFFTEPFTWSFAILGIYALVNRRPLFASVAFGWMLAFKETSLLILLPVVLTAATRLGWRTGTKLMIGPTLYALLFAAKNYLLVGTPFSTFQRYQFGDFLDGTTGLILDPAHGLAWHAPILLLGIGGLIGASRIDGAVRLGAATMFIAYFLLTAAWVDWRGGSGYATRLILPVLPALGLGVALLYRELPRARSTMALLFVAGFVPNWCAATDPFTAFWGIAADALIVKNAVMAGVGLAVALVLWWQVRSRFPSSTVTVAAIRTMS